MAKVSVSIRSSHAISGSTALRCGAIRHFRESDQRAAQSVITMPSPVSWKYRTTTATINSIRIRSRKESFNEACKSFIFFSLLTSNASDKFQARINRTQTYLLGCCIEHVVEGEGFVCAEHNLRFARSDECADSTHVNYLSGYLRSDPVDEKEEEEKNYEKFTRMK